MSCFMTIENLYISQILHIFILTVIKMHWPCFSSFFPLRFTFNANNKIAAFKSNHSVFYYQLSEQSSDYFLENCYIDLASAPCLDSVLYLEAPTVLRLLSAARSSIGKHICVKKKKIGWIKVKYCLHQICALWFLKSIFIYSFYLSFTCWRAAV